MFSIFPTLVQSASLPTTLAAPYHMSASRGSPNHASSSQGPVNRVQQICGFLTQTQQVTCQYCKQLGHVISTCPKQERIHGPYAPRFSVVDSAPASALQPSMRFLSSDQLSQIASYLIQNLGIMGASPTLDFTAMSATSGGSTPRIHDSKCHSSYDC